MISHWLHLAKLLLRGLLLSHKSQASGITVSEPCMLAPDKLESGTCPCRTGMQTQHSCMGGNSGRPLKTSIMQHTGWQSLGTAHAAYRAASTKLASQSCRL